MSRLMFVLSCAVTLLACGPEAEPESEPEASAAVASRSDELIVECPLQNAGSLIVYSRVVYPDVGRCQTRRSGRTNFRVLNPTSQYVKIRVGAAFWWTEYQLAPKGWAGYYGDWNREFFGTPANVEILTPGTMVDFASF